MALTSFCPTNNFGEPPSTLNILDWWNMTAAQLQDLTNASSSTRNFQKALRS